MDQSLLNHICNPPLASIIPKPCLPLKWKASLHLERPLAPKSQERSNERDFSHGITTIVKEVVHKLVIQLYYAIRKMLERFPSPQELTGSVKDLIRQMAENAGDLAGSFQE